MFVFDRVSAQALGERCVLKGKTFLDCHSTDVLLFPWFFPCRGQQWLDSVQVQIQQETRWHLLSLVLFVLFFFWSVVWREVNDSLFYTTNFKSVCVCVLGIPLLWGTFFQVRTKTKGILRLSILWSVRNITGVKERVKIRNTCRW